MIDDENGDYNDLDRNSLMSQNSKKKLRNKKIYGGLGFVSIALIVGVILYL